MKKLILAALVACTFAMTAVPQAEAYIAGRLVCAANVNDELASRGIQGTGSNYARSFQTWGSRTYNPGPGDIAVFSRGRGGRSGHVAIVDHIDANGQVMIKNPGHRGWTVMPLYKQPLEYRTAGGFGGGFSGPTSKAKRGGPRMSMLTESTSNNMP